MKTQLTPYLKYGWKSILAFLSLLATNVATRWVTNQEALPQNGGEWTSFAVTTIGGTWLVYRATNGPKPIGRHAR